jgi:hypothetical protein
MSAAWLGLATFLLLGLILLLVVRKLRRSGITGENARNQHFERLAQNLNLKVVSDDYFIQLEGSRGDSHVVLYPHNFEGPGFITLLYFETQVPAQDRCWIEPNLSLGRAIVEWKRHSSYSFETNGTELNKQTVLEALETQKRSYPYIAVTNPWRFSYSPLLQRTLSGWKNYVLFLAMDAGREPSKEQIEQAMADAGMIANVVNQSVTFSDKTG